MLKKVKQESFKFIDLFAGIGGFHHALSAIGGECVLTCEFDKHCEKIYKNTFKDVGNKTKFVSNIREITRTDIDDELALRTKEEINELVPDHDIICGGFPCQPFSKSGEQKGIKDKTRGTLFFDIMQIVEAKKPSYIFLENVRNISGPRHVDTWKTVIDSIRNLGYQVSSEPLIFSPHLLSPEMDGAPQVRDRVFILGVRNDIDSNQILNISIFNENLKLKKYWDPDKWRIKDLLIPDSNISNINSYKIKDDEEVYLEAWNYFVENFEHDNLPGFPIQVFAWKKTPTISEEMYDWEKTFLTKNSIFYNENKTFLDDFVKMKWGKEQKTVLEFPFSRQILEWQARRYHSTKKGRTLKDLVIQFRPSGIRVKPPTYLPALVAITQTSVVGPKLRKNARSFRKLTPTEASRLQGIPDEVFNTDIVDEKQKYKQLGNAVNVGIVRSVAKILLGLENPDSYLQNTKKQMDLLND
jgi:DNA (cytosine-5)-methyltransferase 1